MHLVANSSTDSRLGAQRNLPVSALPEDIRRAVSKLRSLLGEDAQIELVVVGSKPTP